MRLVIRENKLKYHRSNSRICPTGAILGRGRAITSGGRLLLCAAFALVSTSAGALALAPTSGSATVASGAAGARRLASAPNYASREYD